MRLKSIFENNGEIPSRHTCDGKNISLPLEIFDVPKEAKSLVLIMDDPDIPKFVKEKFKIDIWNHWIVFNIPVEIKDIKEGTNSIGVLGKNTGGKIGYSGPCPPDKEHRYFLKLYALDTFLDLKEGVSKEEVEKAMKMHIIEKFELVGRYKRK